MIKLKLKQRLITLLIFFCICGVIGLAVMIIGIVPIKASSGHWAITKWVLDFSKSRSVALHSSNIKVPPLEDKSLIHKGAGHFETGCVQCHGSPERPASPIALAMTATPPALSPKVEIRDPEELFYIVKHGIKFTGMPAWPAQKRDDEVWALVAFLLELPQMDKQQYQKLTTQPRLKRSGNDSSEPIKGITSATLETCTRCHGHSGQGGGNGAFPQLAGQSREYLLQSLHAYANGDRYSGIMQPVAAVLSEEELSSLADHYAAMPATEPKQQDRSDSLSEAIERGREIAHKGIPEKNVGSCVDCHGPNNQLKAAVYPVLAGQYSNYLVLQLELFKNGNRGGTKSASLMKPVVKGLTQKDISDVAAYYSSLPPSSD